MYHGPHSRIGRTRERGGKKGHPKELPHPHYETPASERGDKRKDGGGDFTAHCHPSLAGCVCFALCDCFLGKSAYCKS